MARVNINPIVHEALSKKYSSGYDGSSKKLYEALDQANQSGEIIGNDVIDVISEKTIRNFFDSNIQNKVLESTLNVLCKFLLNYGSYVEALNALHAKNTEIVETLSPDKLAQTLNQEWLQKYNETIQDDCQMRILEMTQSRSVKEIFTEVKLLGTPKRQQQKTIDELMHLLNTDPNADRQNTTLTSDEVKISGFQAIKENKRLMVLGRPGAGKTTFLKQVATTSMSNLITNENLDRNPLPIYIRLKDFSEARDQETLMDAIQEKVKGIDIKALLDEGQCLFLLDALDEVIFKEVQQVYTDIERFINKYPKNKFIVTCRNAAREYLLENFNLVEIAEFNHEQIQQFVKQWFQADIKTGEQFLSAIDNASNDAVRELAGTPLMLTILCLTFDAEYGLATNRHELYGGMIDVLSRRWDASRRIHREMPYADGLTQERLLDMLAEIAYDGFTKEIPYNGSTKDQPQYFWKRWQLEENIAIFAERLLAFETENKSIASSKVLKAIEANTGIFVEEVRDTYKFAHLTFQEYFTARYIALSDDASILKFNVEKHLVNPQWKEVFRIIPGRLQLRSANEFFLDIFWKINEIGENSNIQELLNQLDVTTRKHGVSSCGWRSLYLAVLRNTYYMETPGQYALARRLASEVRKLNLKRRQRIPATPISRVTTLLLIVYYSIYQQIGASETENIVSNQIDKEVNSLFDQEGQKSLQEAIEQSDLINKDLAEKLTELKDNLPSSAAYESELQEWLNELICIIREFLSIDKLLDLKLNKKDKKDLNDYLYTCNLLVDCIGGDSVASSKLRNQIIDNLLLPKERIPSELQKF